MPVRLPGCMNGGVAGTVRPKSISFNSFAVGRDHEVSRADVAVDEAGQVDRPQRFGRLADELHAAAIRERAAADHSEFKPGPSMNSITTNGSPCSVVP